MPTYQYRCTECGEDLEAVQKFSDPALTTCPTCSGQLRKVFNAVGVVFKGSGFYRTDSRNGSKSGADGDSGSDKSGPESQARKVRPENRAQTRRPRPSQPTRSPPARAPQLPAAPAMASRRPPPEHHPQGRNPPTASPVDEAHDLVPRP